MIPKKSLTWVSLNKVIFWGSLAALIVCFYWWRISVFQIFPIGYDEGIHLILGQLWAAGYIPYREIFVSYPPFFVWSLGIPWQMFNQVSALHLMMSTYALIGVLAVVYLATIYNSRLAGIVAGIILSFTPAYFIPSFAIMTEISSIGLVVAAIALAETYRRSGKIGWALLTGMGLGFGLSLKILPYYAVPLIGLMVISRHIEYPQTSKNLQLLSLPISFNFRKFFSDSIVMAGGFLLTFLLPIFLFDVSALYQQVVEMRLVSTVVETNPFDSKNDDIRDFLFRQPGLMILMLYGLIFVVAQNLRHYWLLVTWFIFIWISLNFLTPLRSKHMPIFLPVMAIFAGFAVNHIYLFLGQIKKEGLTVRATAMLLTIAVTLGIFGSTVPNVIAENNGYTLEAKENEERHRAVEFIHQIALPNDCVIADNPVFLYQTERLPPPQLSETSQTRIDTGYLTVEDIVQSIESYNCHIVAIVTPRFGESLPGLQDWLHQNYLGLHAQSETFVYFAKKGADDNYTPISAGNFDELVQIYGVELSPQPEALEQAGFISLYWQLISPIDTNYIERITLRDSATDKAVSQIERLPFGGQIDLQKWQVGERARDTFRLNIPATVPTGLYDVYLSLCTFDENQCLPLNNQSETELYVGQLTIE